jgi:predicted regulator of Ras-like GTPase activity (Roadblock/LC7/MglB family)
MNDTERLREQRLVFYREEVVRIEALLKELLSLSGAKCALLVDKDGHLVMRTGQAKGFDLDTVAALVAGSFAATREMARLLGEEEFSVMFHQGRRDNIQLSLVGDRTIMTIIFDDQTTVGMVRLYANEAARKLTTLFQQLAAKSENRGPVDIGKDYESNAKSRLEALLPEA